MKSVIGFVMRPYVVLTIAAVTIAVLAAPFGTWPLQPLLRFILWGVLIGANAIKWRLWFGRIGPRIGDGWQGQALLVVGGAVLLNLTLPFEIALVYRLLGIAATIPWAPVFSTALAISLAIGAAVAAAHMPRPAPGSATAEPPAVNLEPPSAAPATVPPPAASGLAVRAGVANLDQVHGVMAEDHYLRLWLADGRAPLILYRFGDAVRELAGCDGLQIHRSAWVAAAAVTGARRQGRRWQLLIVGGHSLPVSEAAQKAVRARGWLDKPVETS
ncbi:MAG: hypothetical protein CFE37_07065 [Alphaproteobacteria bacterium PA4]|nr:MAG: hypothetical protein CFE37_07065 [Alphaproteobacteria bacterium PA4]